MRDEGKEFIAFDSEGNEHRFRSAAAAEQYARQHGTWEPDVTTRTEERESPDEYGEMKKTKTTTTQVTGGRSVKRDKTKSTPGEQSKTKPAWQKEDDDNTMPGVKKNNDNKMPGVK